jgi:hypothetical protein
MKRGNEMVVELMEVGSFYKIRTKEGINFTGEVLQKSETSIQILTIRNEKLILDDEHLDWVKEAERNEVDKNV